jgi:hypothetical protein
MLRPMCESAGTRVALTPREFTSFRVRRERVLRRQYLEADSWEVKKYRAYSRMLAKKYDLVGAGRDKFSDDCIAAVVVGSDTNLPSESPGEGLVLILDRYGPRVVAPRLLERFFGSHRLDATVPDPGNSPTPLIHSRPCIERLAHARRMVKPPYEMMSGEVRHARIRTGQISRAILERSVDCAEKCSHLIPGGGNELRNSANVERTLHEWRPITQKARCTQRASEDPIDVLAASKPKGRH